MALMKTILVLAFFAIACSSEQPRPTTAPPRESAAPITSSAPSASAVATLPPPSPKAVAGNACVMLYECGCNAGCTKVDRPMDALVVGTQVGVTSGPLKGERVFVAKGATASGDSVLTIQRADPNAAAGACALPRSALMGYACEVTNSGAPRACTRCN